MPRTTESEKQRGLERTWLTVKRHPNGITESEIARFTGIQRRTVNNYLNELRDEGKIDKEGTLWFALNYEETRLRAFSLSPEEAYTLYLGSRLLVKQHDKRNEPAETALLKLAEVLTADAGVGQEIAQAARELAQRPARPGYQSVFTTMVRGYIYRKRVAIRYRPLNGRAFDTAFDTYLLEPSAIGYATYVIGYSSLPNALRAYKLERIEEARLLLQEYSVPADFPGLEILRNAWSIIMGDETVHVALRFNPRVRERVLETRWHPSQTCADDPERPGFLRWTADVADTTDMLPWIRGWGAECEVLQPERLRQSLALEAQRIWAVYGGDQAGTEEPAPQAVLVAHTANRQGQRQGLADHLEAVATLAQEFAQPFGAAELAYALGMWHDLGKFHPDFQAYLQQAEQERKRPHARVDHKAAGAYFALEKRLDPLSLLIQGHHGGMGNKQRLKAWLEEHRQRAAEALGQARESLPDLEAMPVPQLPAFTLKDPRAAEFYFRMLFSTLVDADFLDTEAHFTPEKSALRSGTPDLAALWGCLDASQQALLDKAEPTPVNDLRREIYFACLKAAEEPPGFFRLTVPTGGGKTLSGLAFALRHAIRHKLERVIVAVPYISITEQTSQVYREIFAPLEREQLVVLEHHSGAVERIDEPGEYDPSAINARLAAENWDAPLVVTTTVQLFESLFANATSRCRKLHRLANSVIILDEVQALPVHLLDPILDGLSQLCAHYNVTVVLSTATQPAFETLPIFEQVEAREIAPDPARIFRALKRVEYEWRIDPPLDWGQIAALLYDEDQALCVVNTKKDALALLDALGDPHALHLSTLLCGAHRRAVLDEVKRRLAAGEPCRLISTQVVEAGVDLDFPLVLRALGPLSSIIQAGGRANREGRRARGRVIIFDPAEGGLPRGVYRRASQTTRSLLRDSRLDMDDPATTHRFFASLFPLEETDREQIQKCRAALDYIETAQRFRMIDDDTLDVVVPYGSSDEQAQVQAILGDMRAGRANLRVSMRRLQLYLVSIYRRQAEAYQERGLMTPVETVPGLGEWHGGYDPVRGLLTQGPAVDELVV